MKRLALIATTAFALTASLPALCITTTGASAEEGQYSSSDDDGDLRDFLSERLRARREMRRDTLRDLLGARMQRREELRDLISELRDSDDGLRERIRGRVRERLRERFADEGDEDGGGHGLRGRLRERLADVRRGWDGENCYFITRSIRDEDRDFFALVRRRVCRD
jgi:hypothetical protein